MDNRTRGTSPVTIENTNIGTALEGNFEHFEDVKRVISDRLSKTDMRAYRHIGFTKPTLEDRVRKNRKKEKNRRKVFAKTANRTR